MSLFRQQGLRLGVANIHFGLGLVHAGQGKWNEALAELGQGLDHPWDMEELRR